MSFYIKQKQLNLPKIKMEIDESKRTNKRIMKVAKLYTEKGEKVGLTYIKSNLAFCLPTL